VTPLLFAAQQGAIDSARALIAAGANVNDTAPIGTSALVVAAHSGQGAFGAFLLEKGADPNAAGAGYTALHAAILRSDVELVKALVAHGANLHIPVMKATPGRRASTDYQLGPALIGATPFWLAARFDEPGIMRALAAGGADLAFALNDTTALMAAMAGPWPGRGMGIPPPAIEIERLALETITEAVKLGVDVNRSNTAGDTALHTAVSRGFDTVVRFLAEAGARLDVKNKRGQTPLATAVRLGRESTADLLRKSGAKE
jgi:ankyrin repeat protein